MSAANEKLRRSLTEDQRQMLDDLAGALLFGKSMRSAAIAARLGWTPERVATVGSELAALGLVELPYGMQ